MALTDSLFDVEQIKTDSAAGATFILEYLLEKNIDADSTDGVARVVS